MKAVGYITPGPIERTDSLLDLELEDPVATGQDLLVRVRAISVNPVDVKIRAGRPPEGGKHAVLGWDAVGEVVGVGDDVTRFSVGDDVWYAGAIDRPGTNSELHLVDERIVGHKPKSVSDADAAALPLTSLTAWEMLFDRLVVTTDVPGAAAAVLVIGGAGGVGSIAIQLLRARTDLAVIATASRPATKEWVTSLGAHYTIDHSQTLPAQVENLGIGEPGFVFSTNYSGDYLQQVAELIAPQGRFGLIDDPEALDVMPLKRKSVSTHWELMFTRPVFQTADIGRQGEILDEVAAMVDAGTVRTTATEVVGPISAENLRRAHGELETGQVRGKLVLAGF
ncbi:MAG: zinc-binding alcohol dehydrogenase family protein [Acidimicrobiales bacterium]